MDNAYMLITHTKIEIRIYSFMKSDKCQWNLMCELSEERVVL